MNWSKDKLLIPLDDVFCENSKHKNSLVIKYLKVLKLIEYKCKECSIINSYNGKFIKLELHHIDGNNKNNKLENLVFLCPNCHSQTDNFRAKNKNDKPKISDDNLINALKNSSSILAALDSLELSGAGNYKRAKKLILDLSLK